MKETEIRKYAGLMKELGLTGLEITVEDRKIRLERSVPAAIAETVYSVPESDGSAPAASAAMAPKDYISVKSPIVGCCRGRRRYFRDLCCQRAGR